MFPPRLEPTPTLARPRARPLQIMRPNLRGDSLLREKKAQSLTGVKATTRSALRLAQEKAKSKVVGDKATSLSVDDMQSGLENV